jgi:uncharacterized protein YrrD
MLRIGELKGRAVIDMERAEKIGEVEDVVLDPNQGMVAGVVIARGKTVLGGGTHHLLPATAVHSIGPDAVTLANAQELAPTALDGLPRRRDILGRKVVGQSGKMFGHVVDVLVNPADGGIIGYEVGEGGALGGLDELLTGPKTHNRQFVRAEAEFRVGKDIIMVPDEAVITMAVDGDAEELPVGGTGWGAPSATPRPANVWTPPVPQYASAQSVRDGATPAAVGAPMASGMEADGTASFEEMRPPVD